MAYQITSECIDCGECLGVCPVGAISIVAEDFVINPSLCNECSGFGDKILCLSVCLVDGAIIHAPS